jgi:hypothetical protein
LRSSFNYFSRLYYFFVDDVRRLRSFLRMPSQIAKQTVPEWMMELPPDVLAIIQLEAMTRGVPAKTIIKEWTVTAARRLKAAIESEHQAGDHKP